MPASDIAATALFVFGYPTSIAVIARFVPVVRERRIRWFVLHQVAVAAIVAGWAIRGRTSSVLVNGSWFVSATSWYVLGPRIAAWRAARAADTAGTA